MDLGPTTGSSTASPILASDDFTESAAWTVETEISANDVVEKEKLVRYVSSERRSFRAFAQPTENLNSTQIDCLVLCSEIMAMQDGLRALISRVNAVKEDCKKAEADNEMLQTYIDSVTKSLAAKERG